MSGVAAASAQNPLIVTLDVGTSSMRALLFDGRARAVQGLEARRAYALQETADGGVQLDARLLCQEAIDCFDQLYAKATPCNAQVAAVACCTFWHSVVGVDSAGEPVTPVYLWADTRSRAAAGQLRAELDASDYHRRTGCMLHHSYVPAKLLWLRQSAPELYGRVRRWLSFGDYLYEQLLGPSYCSLSMASASGLFNHQTLDWDEGIFRHLALGREQVPPLGDLDEALPPLRAEWSARWRDWKQARWVASVGDGATSNIGSGCCTRQRIALMIGTSGAMRACWHASDAQPRPGLWLYRADGRYILMGGALSNGGIVIGWLQKTFSLPADLDALVERVAPDSHGLTVLPFLLGERSPEWADHARGAVLGLSFHTNPTQIARAFLEAVACRFALIEELLREVVDPQVEIIATGGALLGSRVWRQMMADALGRPVISSLEEEASSRGATLLALRVLGAIGRLDELPSEMGEIFQPEAGRHEIYRGVIERQRKYFEMLVAGREWQH